MVGRRGWSALLRVRFWGHGRVRWIESGRWRSLPSPADFLFHPIQLGERVPDLFLYRFLVASQLGEELFHFADPFLVFTQLPAKGGIFLFQMVNEVYRFLDFLIQELNLLKTDHGLRGSERFFGFGYELLERGGAFDRHVGKGFSVDCDAGRSESAHEAGVGHLLSPARG